ALRGVDGISRIRNPGAAGVLRLAFGRCMPAFPRVPALRPDPERGAGATADAPASLHCCGLRNIAGPVARGTRFAAFSRRAAGRTRLEDAGCSKDRVRTITAHSFPRGARLQQSRGAVIVGISGTKAL